jgi:hypothetical protein
MAASVNDAQAGFGSVENSQMVFVPISWDDALALRAGDDLGVRRCCAATSALFAELDADTTLEEAEFAALSNAGVLALLTSSGVRRLVLAAELDPSQVADQNGLHGEVEASGLSWRRVRALFVDDADASAAVVLARRAVVDRKDGATLGAAMETPEVGELVDAYDLLWFAPEELDQLGENADLTEGERDRAD